MTKGIDVSTWNGNIDWAKVSKSIDFAIIRAGLGRLASQEDKRFKTNYQGCKDNKISIGVYWYNYATTVDDAKAEAKACIEVLKGKTFDMPVWYDIEEKATLNTGKANVSKIAEAFCEELKAAGYQVGIYSFYSALNDSFTEEVKNKYDIWLANVGNNGAPLSSTNYKGHKEIWQYSWTGRLDGIKGDVDFDYCYKEYSAAPAVPVKPDPVVIPTPSQGGGEKIDVTYAAYIGTWLSDVVNCNDTNGNGYAGVENRNISGITVKSSKGYIRYRVHTTNGKWLGWITASNKGNWNTGVAGIKGRNIDGIQAELIGVPGYQIQYRVSTLTSKSYLPWVTGYSNTSAGFAGTYGKNIDKIQMKIVKV